MKPLHFFGILAGLLVASYAVYMYTQASGVPRTIDIGAARNFKSLPPTQCALRDDADQIKGSLYVFHDSARFDVIAQRDGQAISIHLIVGHDDDNDYTTHFWQDGVVSAATRRPYASMYEYVGLGAITHVDCTPWWFPAGADFIPPQALFLPKTT